MSRHNNLNYTTTDKKTLEGLKDLWSDYLMKRCLLSEDRQEIVAYIVDLSLKHNVNQKTIGQAIGISQPRVHAIIRDAIKNKEVDL